MSDSIQKLRRRPARRAAGLLNCLTLILLLLAGLGALGAVLLFQFPGVLAFIPGGSRYMPAPEPATAVALVTPTPLPISTDESGQPIYPTFPPTWTPEDTPTVTATPGPATASAIPTNTATAVTKTPIPSKTLPPTQTNRPPTATGPTPTATATQSQFNYTLQPGNPTYLSNFLNNQGCNWFGIVGRAFGSDGNPKLNLTVHLEGAGLTVDTLTGSGSPALGPGGYQIPIADHPIATTDVYTISTFGDCTQNMVMVNFVQNH